MKKLVILFFFIQASIICSDKRHYLNNKVKLNVGLINKDGSLSDQIIEEAYNQSVFYKGENKVNTFIDSDGIKKTLQEFFELGKTYNNNEEYNNRYNQLNSAYTNLNKKYNTLENTKNSLAEDCTELSNSNNTLITTNAELLKNFNDSEKKFNDLSNQSLIKFLNSYSTPAKIGFGVAGIIVVVSVVYSGRQLYLFSKQKYSDWKAKKEDESLEV